MPPCDFIQFWCIGNLPLEQTPQGGILGPTELDEHNGTIRQSWRLLSKPRLFRLPEVTECSTETKRSQDWQNSEWTPRTPAMAAALTAHL